MLYRVAVIRDHPSATAQWNPTAPFTVAEFPASYPHRFPSRGAAGRRHRVRRDGTRGAAEWPRNGRLTAEQKAGNRVPARRRIVAEHGAGKMNVWRVAAEWDRGRRRGHTLIMKNVAGLHNLMFA